MDDRNTPTSRRSVLASAGAAIAATAGCLGSVDDVDLLDVRNEGAFDDARTPGAYHFPNAELLDTNAEETTNGFRISPEATASTLSREAGRLRSPQE